VYVTLAVQFAPAPDGVHEVPVMALRVPWLGLLTMLNVRLPLSLSAPATVMTFAVSSFVVTLWPLAVGASFTAFTVIVTVAVFESAIPSLALKVKLSEPL
jgi:hypothetical protein